MHFPSRQSRTNAPFLSQIAIARKQPQWQKDLWFIRSVLGPWCWG